jgi:hypothetical protein
MTMTATPTNAAEDKLNPNRSDLLLIVISTLAELRPHTTLQEINSVLKYLANEFHPEAFHDFRDGARQRALVETLAYLDENNLITNPDLKITRTGTARITSFAVLKDSVYMALMLRYLVQNFGVDQTQSLTS